MSGDVDREWDTGDAAVDSPWVEGETGVNGRVGELWRNSCMSSWVEGGWDRGVDSSAASWDMKASTSGVDGVGGVSVEVEVLGVLGVLW